MSFVVLIFVERFTGNFKCNFKQLQVIMIQERLTLYLKGWGEGRFLYIHFHYGNMICIYRCNLYNLFLIYLFFLLQGWGLLIQQIKKGSIFLFWHERAAFQRSAFGRLTAGNDVVAAIIISLFSFSPRFLAAMSSSRNDIVTQFVCVFVCVSLFFLLVSLFSFSVIEVSSSP